MGLVGVVTFGVWVGGWDTVRGEVREVFGVKGWGEGVYDGGVKWDEERMRAEWSDALASGRRKPPSLQDKPVCVPSCPALPQHPLLPDNTANLPSATLPARPSLLPLPIHPYYNTLGLYPAILSSCSPVRQPYYPPLHDSFASLPSRYTSLHIPQQHNTLSVCHIIPTCLPLDCLPF
ncbi:hypothetical protein Pcinc_034581 [Petrolisthes cinctipes]|uniref:Uncharacterized protein n=1 Tax=Petrolisthes cinctipes TaxID=88211 RepID=A0AAE1EP35_PETCI|nr:hypothetical protein Pcinc_034581 [Petrolisthes cinctipes]